MMLAEIDAVRPGALAQPGCTPARVVAVGTDGTVYVACGGDDDAVRACRLLETAEGATLVLDVGDDVLAWLPADDAAPGFVLGRAGPARRPTGEARSGEEVPDSLVLEARESLTLRCGDGSITIRADGRILIRGRDLVSHAQRMNRIRGGAVAIN